MKKQSKIGELILAMVICAAILLLCKAAEAQVLPEYNAFPNNSVGVGVGTQGFDFQATHRLFGFLNVRAGLNTVPDLAIKYNDRQVLFNRTSVFAMVDYQPKYGSSDWLSSRWYVTAGMAYYFSNSVYRQGVYNDIPNYTIYLSKVRPYIGTGLGNIRVINNIFLRADLGYFIPLSSPTSTLAGKETKVSSGMRGILPGLNTGLTFYIKL